MNIINFIDKKHLAFMIICFVLVILTFLSVIYLLVMLRKLTKEGIEVKAKVVKCESEYDTNTKSTYFLVYVKYVGEDEKEHLACCYDNPREIGTIVKIKYLPKKYKVIKIIN